MKPTAATTLPLPPAPPVTAAPATSPQPAQGPAEFGTTTMRVRKRNGTAEPVDLNKIVRAVGRSCMGLSRVDVMRVATKTISGLYDGATTRELDSLSIQTAAALIVEEPEYARLSSRLLATFIQKEVSNQDIHSFSQSIAAGHKHGLIADRLLQFVQANARKLNAAIDPARNDLFEYFGLRTVYDRYLLKNPQTREVIETPQEFFLRVACALSGDNAREAIELYRLFSSLEYLPSSPTLFNSGTRHEQLSSCFLLDSPADELDSIYKKYSDIAMLSKFSGGIGVGYHRVRARGSLIRSTNGHSNGIVPWLKTLDASVAAVNQGGKRKGACCVYLESWHADIEDFLELRDNTGDEARRTHNLNLANWVPDLFMRRVETDGDWSLFDPKTVPHLTDLWGDAFDKAYAEAEASGVALRKVKARDLYARMMKVLAQTGNGWMTFKDLSNRKSNQTAKPANVIHLSNLCTEILEVTSQGETAVCNLGSLNLGRMVADGKFDFERLRANVQLALRQLDRVIDLNYYPIPTAADSNRRWRPVGLGLMGLQDVFFQLRLPFDAPEARALSQKISEEIYYAALSTSADLAEQFGAHPGFSETRAAQGELQFESWGVVPEDTARWSTLRARIQKTGLRNSLMIAIAPTATIASIAGCYECIEPQVSNLFKRETLSGDFLQVNRYLVRDLQALGLWNDSTRNRIKMAEGSVQDLTELPAELRNVYRTAWEIPMRSLIDMAADRGAFIDQSQSLNLFVETPNIGKLSSMYFYAWQKGLKTTYYLRSRPATRIAKATVGASGAAATSAPAPAPMAQAMPEAEAVACSLENPESCEACQ
ncbi:ribonucleoside-diphosphate reductase subunit alpha [Corallococcus sp. H22C18031201]|uniref:ribonucleoside-diphosphate reductase subunit alpha n=1 Tax=Citreicoccus inhibens TaxID=2849499 RepID=UPI000E756C8D|nr:ribonucleoside-diphosphate reductase subunit alpha [Citreicoccus inhibens]RJS19202.1 ribonucleoside-diphosphate reductase subunit alpha [Corallococcus sp. H22C18031201]